MLLAIFVSFDPNLLAQMNHHNNIHDKGPLQMFVTVNIYDTLHIMVSLYIHKIHTQLAMTCFPGD